MKNLSPVEKFKELYRPKKGKSKLWDYKEEIRELLENEYLIKQIYEYLRDFRQIKQKPRTVYDFIQRNRDKILNDIQLNPVNEINKKIQSNPDIKTDIAGGKQKDNQITMTIKKDIQKPSQNKNTETLKPKTVSNPDEAKKSNIEQNREKYKVTINEYKKYLDIYEKGIKSLDPIKNPKLSKEEFIEVIKMVYKKYDKTFDDLYNLYKIIFEEGRYPEFKENTAERKLVIFFVFANKDKKVEVQTSINAGIPPFRPWEKISDFGW